MPAAESDLDPTDVAVEVEAEAKAEAEAEAEADAEAEVESASGSSSDSAPTSTSDLGFGLESFDSLSLPLLDREVLVVCGSKRSRLRAYTHAIALAAYSPSA